jgi:hypothetical protein
MAGAIAVAFGVMMFLTVWYSPDCRSVAVGGALLVAGCGGCAMNDAPLSELAHRDDELQEPIHYPRRLLSWLVCLIGLHNWWDAGEGEFVCLDCGKMRGAP